MNEQKDSQESPFKSVWDYNQAFVYEKDKRDGWSITAKGDCDDYALSVAYILSDNNFLKLILGIIFFRFTFLYVETHRGIPHVILKYRGRYIDNITKSWQKSNPYKKLFPYIFLPPVIFIKMLLGYVRN